jgi:hypothetical protein
MKTKVELKKDDGVCLIFFDKNMDDAETTAFLEEFGNMDTEGIDKFIGIVPDEFSASERFRKQLHRKILDESKSNPSFRVAVVTKLLQVVGYERFAKFVTKMLDKEQVFQNLDDALDWIKSA